MFEVCFQASFFVEPQGPIFRLLSNILTLFVYMFFTFGRASAFGDFVHDRPTSFASSFLDNIFYPFRCRFGHWPHFPEKKFRKWGKTGPLISKQVTMNMSEGSQIGIKEACTISVKIGFVIVFFMAHCSGSPARAPGPPPPPHT